MALKIVFFIFSVLVLNLSAVEKITFTSYTDFKKCNIINGEIKYYKSLEPPGYGVGLDFKRKFVGKETDLFLDFNKEKIYYDRTMNYKVNYYNVMVKQGMRLNNSTVGMFKRPEHKVILDVSQDNYLAEAVDLKNFSIDFYISLTEYSTKNIIMKKGTFFEDKFYGIIIKIEGKRVVIQLENLFYDMNEKVYSFKLKSDKRLDLNNWYHIGFQFKRTTGQILLYINGVIDREGFATKDGYPKSEILTPKFKKFDGSDLVLFKNFIGYADNFRISQTTSIDFKQYIDSMYEEATIISPLFDFKYINSMISNIRFKVRNSLKNIISIYSKYGNRKSDIKNTGWIENKDVIFRGDMINLKEFKPLCRYYQWKVVMRRNPKERKSPVLYSFKLKYVKNRPPLPPYNIKIYARTNIYILEWDNNLESDLLGYIIYWGCEPRTYENKLDVGLKNSYIFNSLVKNKNYYFRVKAYDTMDVYQTDKFSENLVTVRTQYNLSRFSKEVHQFIK